MNSNDLKHEDTREEEEELDSISHLCPSEEAAFDLLMQSAGMR